MPATTLNCPTCGASISSDETSCRYCGTRLATIACPNCFGMMFVGGKFCPHCGTATQTATNTPEPALPCPDCKIPMDALKLKQTILRECSKCQGLWVTVDSFRRICAEQERQVDILGAPALAPQPTPIAKKAFRYRGCPVCNRLMNRYNFANASGIIIDSCVAHGVWFDRDELREIIEFIRAGGVQLADQSQRERELAKQRWLKSNPRSGDENDISSSISATGGLTGFMP